MHTSPVYPPEAREKDTHMRISITAKSFDADALLKTPLPENGHRNMQEFITEHGVIVTTRELLAACAEDFAAHAGDAVHPLVYALAGIPLDDGALHFNAVEVTAIRQAYAEHEDDILATGQARRDLHDAIQQLTQSIHESAGTLVIAPAPRRSDFVLRS